MNHVMTSSCTSSSSSNFFPARCFFLRHILPIHNVTINSNNLCCEFPLDVPLSRWEIVWRNAPRIWRDFGSALPFQIRLTQTKPVLPLSNEHGSQVKDQGRRQCCHNRDKKLPYRPTRDVSLLSGHASYVCMYMYVCMYVCVYVYICTYVCVYVCIYIYTYTHTQWTPTCFGQPCGHLRLYFTSLKMATWLAETCRSSLYIWN